MRLPHPLSERLCFVFDGVAKFISAMGETLSDQEKEHIDMLFRRGLPPVTSERGLATLLGYNPRFVWSLLHQPQKHYNEFSIPKGRTRRRIQAPRVGLKLVQKWLSIHFQNRWTAEDCVFGFVPGRSHVDAAQRHLGAHWVYSVDIENFFPSISKDRVKDALRELGYSNERSPELISGLCCLEGRLVQGSPTSLVLSNIVLSNVDKQLTEIAARFDVRYTRYADDIVVSGEGDVPMDLFAELKSVLEDDCWKLAQHKERLDKLPNRLKVHGFLVHGERLRLTKGYRNQLRAFRHLLQKNGIRQKDLAVVKGHLSYSSHKLIDDSLNQGNDALGVSKARQ